MVVKLGLSSAVESPPTHTSNVDAEDALSCLENWTCLRSQFAEQERVSLGCNSLTH
jgi:hypothetical protein